MTNDNVRRLGDIPNPYVLPRDLREAEVRTVGTSPPVPRQPDGPTKEKEK